MLAIENSLNRFYKSQELEELFEKIDKWEDAVDKSVGKAYSDACRPLKGITDNEERNKNKNTALDEVKKYIIEFFLKNSNLDCFHRQCCEKWTKSDLDDQYRKFGTAQKIVNMSLKYLYCWDIKKNQCHNKEKFDSCHMTIDSFTLKWLIDNDEDRRKKVDLLKGISKETAWTSLSDEDYYKKIIEFIKKLKESSKLWKEGGVFYNLSILEAEFVIWDYEKMKSALLPIKKVLDEYSEKEIIASYKVSECKEKLELLIENIQLKDFAH